MAVTVKGWSQAAWRGRRRQGFSPEGSLWPNHGRLPSPPRQPENAKGRNLRRGCVNTPGVGGWLCKEPWGQRESQAATLSSAKAAASPSSSPAKLWMRPSSQDQTIPGRKDGCLSSRESHMSHNQSLPSHSQYQPLPSHESRTPLVSRDRIRT